MEHPPHATIASVWGTEPITHTEQVTQGVLSTNWILHTPTTRHFLKRYRFDDPVRIQEIHDAKHLFAAAGVPVILPLPTTQGTTFYEHAGWFFALFPFVTARSIDRTRLTETAIVSMAHMLARIHHVGKVGTTPTVTQKKMKMWGHEDDRMATYHQRLVAHPNPTPFDIRAREDLEIKQELLKQHDISFESLGLSFDHLIHGDFLDHNLFFDAHDQVSHVFDLEKACLAPRSYELIRTVLYSVLAEDYSSAGIARGAVFVRSYREQYPMSDDELRASLECIFLKSLRSYWIHKECYDLNNRRPEPFLETEMTRIQYLSDHRDELFAGLVAP